MNNQGRRMRRGEDVLGIPMLKGKVTDDPLKS